MLITLVLSAVSLTTGAAVSNATKVALSATTTALSLHGQLTNAASQSELAQGVNVFWAVSPFSITAGAAPIQLRKQAELLEVDVSRLPSGVLISKSELITADGAYLYLWVENANLTGSTLSVNLVEMN